MSNCACSNELLYSELAADADLAELIELFVSELPDRIAHMRQALEGGNAELLCRLAHQLKGAGGSHGFPHLGPAAWKVENAAREIKELARLSACIDELEAVCSRARAGLPSDAREFI